MDEQKKILLKVKIFQFSVLEKISVLFLLYKHDFILTVPELESVNQLTLRIRQSSENPLIQFFFDIAILLFSRGT